MKIIIDTPCIIEVENINSIKRIWLEELGEIKGHSYENSSRNDDMRHGEGIVSQQVRKCRKARLINELREDITGLAELMSDYLTED